MEYIAFMHKNTDSVATSEEWERFLALARDSGLFQGGSEVGERTVLGEKAVADTSASVGGYMRFETSSINELNELLRKHPTIIHGGTIEICELPKS